jgi:dihydroxy-acid dehydratase
VEEGDLIEIDIPERRLNIVGIDGEIKTPDEMEEILLARKQMWVPKERRYKSGALRLFSEHAVSPMKGAYLDY